MPYTRFFYSFIGIAGILLAVMFAVPDAYAQTAVTCPDGGRKIQLMVGVPGLQEESCDRSLPQIINQFYLFLITIGAIIGVVKIGIAGFKYATSDIISSKSEAKQDIQGVFLGLIILLIPFLVLNAISPNAAKLDVLKLTPIGTLGSAGNTTANNTPSCGQCAAGSNATLANGPCAWFVERCNLIPEGTLNHDTSTGILTCRLPQGKTCPYIISQEVGSQSGYNQIIALYPKQCFACLISSNSIVRDCYNKITAACTNGVVVSPPNNARLQVCRVRSDAVCPPTPEGFAEPTRQ